MEQGTEDQDFSMKARDALRGQWCMSALTTFAYIIPALAATRIPYADLIGSVLFTIGYCKVFLMVARGEPIKINNLFYIFTSGEVFCNGILLYFAMMFVICIGLLLFIIPAFIFSLMFSQAYYIMIDTPTIGPIDAMVKSARMMEEHKLQLLCLTCSFIGWVLLSILSLGIGFFWLFPYMHVTFSFYYLRLKEMETLSGEGSESFSEALNDLNSAD